MKALIERPVATAMVYLALLVLGVYSFIKTPLELIPSERYPQVTISAAWPGAPPEIIQSRVTAPLEEASSEVKGVRKMTSSSRVGYANVVLEFDPKTDMEFATLALRESLSKKRPVLPPNVRPVIQPYVPEELQTQPFMQYTISGDYPLQTLRGLVKDKIEFGIGAIRGVAGVDVWGGSDPEIRVVLDKKKLQAYSIQPYRVTSAISQRLRTYPSGRVRQGNEEFLFKYTDSITGLDELGETVVAYLGSNPIRIRDVARIETTYADVSRIHRINEQPTLSVYVAKEGGANTLRVSREVKRKLEEIKKELPKNLVFRVVNDESDEIRKNLNNLYLLAGLITVIVFAMIFVILRQLAPSLLILSSIAFSVVVTFNLIYIFKISLNILTLGALALGFGMFVDNAIVVFDHILRFRERGVPAKEAAIRAPREVFVAVLASTLTTVAAFCAFPYFSGRLKIYYLPIAIVIPSALLTSLVVAFTLIPALSPKIRLRPARTRERASKGRFDRLLRFALRHPLEVVLLVAALLFGSYKWFRSEVVIGEWFRGWYSKQYLVVRIGMPGGTGIERTDEAIRKFEDLVMAQPYEKEMNASVQADNAILRIGFPGEIELSYRPYVLKEELIQLATQYAGVDISVSGFDPQYYGSSMGVGTWYSSRIAFYGYSLKKLNEITDELEKTIKRNPRIKETRKTSDRYGWGWRGDFFENILKIDKAALRRYNLDPLYLYWHLRTLIQGQFGAPMRIRTGGEEIQVAVKFPEADTLDMRALREALIMTTGGEYLRLGDVAAFAERPVAGSIDRENQQFQQTLWWEFRGPAKAEERYRKAVFNSLSLPPGFSAKLEETYRISQKEQKEIWFALAVSLILIYMIMTALYESFVHPLFVMLAVPLALIGVYIAFVIAGAAFDSSAYIGVILLGGIVVNNAILLVDHINLKRRQGREFLEAVIEGTRDRIRPIFMTTTTTVFGIIPLLIITTETGRQKIWSALALCMAGGLVTSTLFILVVIPIAYFHGEKLRGWAASVGRAVRAGGLSRSRPPSEIVSDPFADKK
jgi:HAE1 family hydrophobic/amphiphilic exporter-1